MTKILFYVFLMISIVLGSCASENLNNKLDQTETLTVNEISDSATAIQNLKQKLQGNWQLITINDSIKFVGYFQIKSDTFIASKKNKYLLKLSGDSTFSGVQILTKAEHERIKPSIMFPRKIVKITNDSLVLMNWLYGKKNYSYYLKKNGPNQH